MCYPQRKGVSPHFLHFFGGIFLVKDESLEDSANLADPDIIAAEIVEDLPPSPRLWRDKPSRPHPVRRNRV